jgi:hypothetical protein
MESVLGRCGFILTACVTLVFFDVMAQVPPAHPDTVLFDFDNAPIHSPLPISQTVSGITARFSGTGQGYSIQAANTMGFTPQGFAGNCIYPSSIYLADLLIGFDQALAYFSIMYSCQELGCDDAATMRVTAYSKGNLVGTNTKTASVPGTWPVDTLSCGFSQGFDSVVVHYDKRPPTCQDYGVIFLADNMRVTRMNVTAISEGELPETFALRQNYPNPFNSTTTISFSLPSGSFASLKVFDLMGREVAVIVSKMLPAGDYQQPWNANDILSGIYFYRLQAGSFTEIKKLVLLR